ncbi:MAG: LptF/LptG family permease [Bacteroidales bacterium]|nr:LptF/LptG family permease [Bacteroidales bacterium]MBQ9313224.1 LptF/LptG family permease [Bacteroidales bacterium]
MKKGRTYFLNRLDWYIIGKILATFAIAIILIILIIIIIDLGQKIDDFIDHKAPIKAVIFDYYLYTAPYYVNTFGHLFFFISVVFVTSRLTARSEIISILSAGISFGRMLRPFIFSAVVVGVFGLYLSNFLIPQFNVKKYEFERLYYRNTYVNMQFNIHIQNAPNKQVYVQRFDNATNSGVLFTQETFNKNKVVEKITANIIRYDSVSKMWIMDDYSIRTINGKNEKLAKGYNDTIDIHLTPKDFNMKLFKVDVLDFQQLNKTITRERMKGTNKVTDLLLEKYTRLLNPLAYIILTLIGVSLSCKKKRGGMGLNLASGIGLAFALILVMKITATSATNGNMNPLLSVALPLILFSFVAGWLIIKAPK